MRLRRRWCWGSSRLRSTAYATLPILKSNRLGLQADNPVKDDWSLTQQVAIAFREAGFEGILAPSEAGPYVNLIVFSDRLLPDSRVDHLVEQDKDIPPIA